MRSQSNSFLKSSFLLTITLVLCKLMAFIRAALLSRALGVSVETDVFLSATTIISLFTNLLTYPVTQAFLPELARYEQEGEIKKAQFISSIYTFILIIGFVFTAIELLFAEQIIAVAMPGMSVEGRQLLKSVLYIQFPCILTAVLGSVNRGMLNYKNRFSVAEMLTYIGTFSTVVYLLLFYHNANVYGLAAAFTMGSIIMSVIQFALIKKDGYKLRLSFKVPDRFKLFILSCSAFAIGGAVRDINSFCDKAIASLIGEGSISLLSYANRLIVSEVSIISTAVCMVTFVHIAKAWSNKDLTTVKEQMVNSAVLINFAYFLVAALTIVCNKEIISVIYGGGQFSSDNIEMVASALMFYGIGLFGYGMHDLFVYSMNATQLIKYSVGMNVCVVIMNVFGNLMLYKAMGINGVALASSVSMIVMNIPMFLICNNRIVDMRKTIMFSETAKMFCASLGGIALGIIVRKFLIEIIPYIITRLIILAGVIIAFYLLMLFVMKSDSTKKMIQLLQTRFNRAENKVK